MKSDLPQTVLNALSSDEYIYRDGLSATTLIKPPQMRVLQKRYGEDKKNPIDNLWSVFGTAVHNVMEKNASEGVVSERHLSREMFNTVVHGTVDHYENGVISDFKVTSCFKYVKKDFEDWERQLNIYAYLLRMDGVAVNKLQIIGIFRDWSKNQALRNKDYPQQAIQTIPIKLWTEKEAKEYIQSRVEAHLEAEDLSDEELPPCTEKDRWYSGTVYAVMKGKNKRAVKLYDNLKDAEVHAEEDKAFRVEIRPGENRMCQGYCPVASKCKQWKRIQEDG